MNGLAVCAGVAGIELGLREVLPGYRTVAYVEREAYAVGVLAARMEDGTLDAAPVWDDLRSFPGWRFRGAVDIVSAGIPCQPFSCAGKRRGTADERWLWPTFWRCVCDVGAWCLFVENVPGIVRHGFSTILGDLAASGWSAEWDVFSALGSGAPHLRKRVFLLAADPFCVRCGIRGTIASVAASISRQEWETAQVDAGWKELERFIVTCMARGDWQEPATESRRVADGVPHRVDRLRALGNAVVPAVAARAFGTLWHRLTGEIMG